MKVAGEAQHSSQQAFSLTGRVRSRQSQQDREKSDCDVSLGSRICETGQSLGLSGLEHIRVYADDQERIDFGGQDQLHNSSTSRKGGRASDGPCDFRDQ